MHLNYTRAICDHRQSKFPMCFAGALPSGRGVLLRARPPSGRGVLLRARPPSGRGVLLRARPPSGRGSSLRACPRDVMCWCVCGLRVERSPEDFQTPASCYQPDVLLYVLSTLLSALRGTRYCFNIFDVCINCSNVFSVRVDFQVGFPDPVCIF